MAGAALGAPQARSVWQAWHFQYLHGGLRKPRFVWQVQHLELPSLDLCGKRGTFSTFMEVCGSLATSLSCVDAASFCVAGAAFGARQARSVWQAWHCQNLHRGLRGNEPVLCGRPRVALSFIEVCRSLATSLSCVDAASFCVAGAALGAPQARSVWQAWHFQYSDRGMRKLGDYEPVLCGRRLVLCGRRSTWSSPGSICVAGVALSV